MRLRHAILPCLALILAVIGCQPQVVGGDDDDGDGDGSAASEVKQCKTEQRECDPGPDSYYSDGIQFCTVDEKGAERWTECCGWDPDAGAQEGLGRICFCEAPWETLDEEDCNTPLVLAFASEAVTYTSEMAGSFDLSRVGMSVATDWPTAATPWLALDRDGNGSIDSGAELFGSATKLASGKPASNGFVALAELDDNKDGVIDGRDAAFTKLVVWRDADASRSSEASELSPAAAQLEAIELSYKVERRCDERGNCEVERAAFRFVDESGAAQSGSVVDVHLKRR